MIIAVGVSYYTLWEGVDRRRDDILQDMMQQDRDAADENLNIQYIALTGGNSLNLTIKNTGNIISHLEWIGVFDETLNTKQYFGIETSLNPLETQTTIGNTSITMNPANTYIIQVLTRLGNIYYGEYPMPVDPGVGNGGGGSNETQYYFVDLTGDNYAPPEFGSHSLFSAMQAGPDYVNDTLTEAQSSFEGLIADTVVDSLEFDTGDCSDPSVVFVSGDIYAIAYEGPGGDGWLKTVSIDSTGQIGITPISQYEFDTNTGDNPEIIHVSGDVYAIVYAGPGRDGFIKTVEIAANGIITQSTIDTLEYNNNNGETPSILHVSGDFFAIAYDGPGTDGWLTTVEIAANGAITNTVVDTLEFDAVTCLTPNIMHVSGNYYAIVYEGSATQGIVTTVEIDTNGVITNTIVDSWVFEANQCDHPQIIPVSGDVYAIVFRGENNDGDVATLEISTTGVITNALLDIFQFDLGNGNTPMITHVQGDYYAIAYTGGGNDGFVVTVEITAAGAITDVVVDTLEFAPTDGQTPFIIQITSTVYAIAYRGAGGDGFITTIELEGGAYKLDLEVSWTGLPTRTNEFLTVYGGVMGAETLQVDYWNGSTWVNVIPSVTAGYNLVDVSSYLLGSSFTIRFVDSVQLGDSVEESWEIDAVFLNLFD